MSKRYGEFELMMIEAIWNDAATTEDEDAYYTLVVKMDPDGEVYDALRARDLAAEQERRARLPYAERVAEDAFIAKMARRAREWAS